MFGRRTSASRGGGNNPEVNNIDDKVAILMQTVAKLQQQIEVLTGDGEALRGQLRMLQTGHSQASNTGSIQSSVNGWGGEPTIASRTSALESQTNDLNQRLLRLDKVTTEIKDYIDDQRAAAEFSKQLHKLEESGMMPANVKIPRCSSPASSIRSSVYGGQFDEYAAAYPVGGLLPAPSFPRNANRALPPVGGHAGRDGRRRMDPGPSHRPYTGGQGSQVPKPVGAGGPVRASHGALPRASPSLQAQLRPPPALAPIPSGWEVPSSEAKAGRRAINSPSMAVQQQLSGNGRRSPKPMTTNENGLIEPSRDSFSALMIAVSAGGAPPSPPPLSRVLMRPQVPGSLGTPTGAGSQHGGLNAW